MNEIEHKLRTAPFVSSALRREAADEIDRLEGEVLRYKTENVLLHDALDAKRLGGSARVGHE